MSWLRRLVWGMSLGASTLQLSVLLVAMTLTGCATQQAERQTYPGDARAYVADAGAEGRKAKEDLEGDGMPAQLPPIQRARPLPDDPTQPWSPNYGTVRSVRSASAAE